MKSTWKECKNILCVRPDNMGDLIMSGPAIRALKRTFNAKITVLTSSMAAAIAGQMEEIDEVITCDMPWVKNDSGNSSPEIFQSLIDNIKHRDFDAAVIFTVYSQNPMPSVMLTYLAAIPLRLAYCRENPYQLLTNWIPDPEPYDLIRHQVKRDLDLVENVGAITVSEDLCIKINKDLWPGIEAALVSLGFDLKKKWLILHAGVSEIKREYPIDQWVLAGKEIINDLDYQVILTGSFSEKQLTEDLQRKMGKGSFSTGGLFNLEELITLISMSCLMVSVNTGTVHISAAVNTPVVVLYALTNPQHTPWEIPCEILPFKVRKALQSKNQVIQYVDRFYNKDQIELPSPKNILIAVKALLSNPEKHKNKELCLINRIKESVNPL